MSIDIPTLVTAMKYELESVAIQSENISNPQTLFNLAIEKIRVQNADIKNLDDLLKQKDEEVKGKDSNKELRELKSHIKFMRSFFRGGI